MEILGRDDAQVKVRGFRVELGEIEHAALAAAKTLKFPLRAAACDARDNDVVLHVALFDTVVADEWQRFEALLIAKLSVSLASYMVPRRVVPIANMPLSANGKLDQCPGKPRVFRVVGFSRSTIVFVSSRFRSKFSWADSTDIQ